MERKAIYIPNHSQKLAHACSYLYTLVGGARGGGKTTFESWEGYHLGHEFPGNVGIWVRKIGTHFVKSTLQNWIREIPAHLYKLNEQKKTITLLDVNSVIWYGGLDDREAISQFTSLDAGFFLVDQAEEISKDDFRALAPTLRLKRRDGERPRYRGILSCNPAPCWLKDDFILNPKPDYKFIQFLPGDNPGLAKNYVSNLYDIYQGRQELINAFIKGSWDELEGGNLVIQWSDIEAATDRVLPDMQEVTKRLISCDVARYGNDLTVWYAFKDGRVMGYDKRSKESLMETAGRLKLARKEYQGSINIVEEDGIGGGVIDRLAEFDEPIRGVNMASRPDDMPEEFANQRAWVWWEAADMFRKHLVSIPNDPILKGDLGAVRYFIKNGKIQVEDKDEIQKRLGRSPDSGTACVLGLFGLRYASSREEDKKVDDYIWQDRMRRTGIEGGY